MSNRYFFPNGSVFYRHLNHTRPQISHGEGIYLYDDDGERYIDGAGGLFAVSLGHGRQRITDAAREQMEKIAYVHGEIFTNQAVEAYSAALATLVPVDDPRFYFLSSGAGATEAALKLARQVQLTRDQPHRTHIIGQQNSSHGMTLGALAASGRAAARQPYLEMLTAATHIEAPYPYRDDRGGAEIATALDETIQKLGAENVAAFIAEPINTIGLGVAIPPQAYWRHIRRVCDRYDVLLIIDEQITGMGRTGSWWAIDAWEIKPDILLAANNLTNGYIPLSMMAVSRKLLDPIQRQYGDFNHGATFSHHAVGAAAGLATLEILQEDNLIEQAATRGDTLGEKLQAALADHPHVGDIRGRGLCWGIEIVEDKETKAPFSASEQRAWRLWRSAFEEGLSLYYSQGCANGEDGDTLLLGPPYTVTDEQLDDIVNILKRVFETSF